jgi:hypothetical protein
VIALVSQLLLGCGGHREENMTDTVEKYLTRHALSLEEARYLDEPPGKLRQIVVRGRDGRTHRIDVLYTVELFSAERRWSRQAVLQAAIARVSSE